MTTKRAGGKTRRVRLNDNDRHWDRRGPAKNESDYGTPEQRTQHWNPDDFIVPGRDAKGAQEKTTVPMQPHMWRFICKVVGQGVFPYETPADLIRHALLRHLRYLCWIDDIDESTVHLIQAVEAANAQKDLEDRGQEAILELIDRVTGLVNSGQPMQARIMVVNIRQMVSRFPDSPTKTRYLARLRQDFPDF